jgi:sarcosine oxidase, subunit beta
MAWLVRRIRVPARVVPQKGVWMMAREQAGRRVAVIGGGVIGFSIALHLRERGLGATVYERTSIGAGASGVQPGGVRRQWSTREHCLLADESYAFYRQANAALEPRTPFTLDEGGYLFLAHSPQQLEQLAANVALQNELDIPSAIVDPDAIAELVPGLDVGSVVGAAWCGTDGYFDNAQAVVEAFAAAAVRRGAALEIRDVVEILRDDAGWSLRFRDGSRAEADDVVLAAGWESAALARDAGVELPIVDEAHHAFLSEPVRERLLEPLVISPERRFVAKQLANGRVLASDLHAVGNPDGNRDRWRATVRDGIAELLPLLEYVNFATLVGGSYDVTPDHSEILGPIGDAPGLWVAAGFSGHGFMMAPAVGRALGDWIGGEDPGEAARAFTLDRFARGSLQPETQIV